MVSLLGDGGKFMEKKVGQVWSWSEGNVWLHG